MSKSFIASTLILIALLFGGGAYFSDKAEQDQKATSLAAVSDSIESVAPSSFDYSIEAIASTPTPTAIQSPVSDSSQLSPFTRDLMVGSRGNDVKLLQVLLNASGFKIATQGVGSPGRETTLFGAGTAKALARLQCDRGIACSGRADEETRQILNALYNLTHSGIKTIYKKRVIR